MEEQSWQQFLTEKVLGEEYHKISCTDGMRRCSCGTFGNINTLLGNHRNRTFTTRNDLMDLYEAVNRDEKIWQFEKVCWEKLKTEFPLKTMEDILNLVTPWLFCLDGEGHEERCKIVAAFYGWEGENE